MLRLLSLSLIVLLAAVSVLSADPVELAYDNGSYAGAFQDLTDRHMEGVCFSPAHPCSLLSVRIYTVGSGTMEVHVWGDNGAHEPDQTNDLIEPIEVDVSNGRWTTIDLSEAGLVFDPPRDFHIGHHCRGARPSIGVDNGDPFEQRSHLWAYNQGLRAWLWHTIGGNFMVRATVEYFNELDEDEFTFQDVTENSGIGGLGNMAWGDYDNDGWEDLLVSGRTLYRNQGDNTFEDVSDEADIIENNPGGTGTWGDFDNDGWLDFFAGNSRSDVMDNLFRNNGDGTFTIVNEDVWFYNGQNPTAGAGWGDANNDGCLEIYIANSEYWNDGNPEYFLDHAWSYDPRDEVFFEITPEEIRQTRYYGRGVAWCDFDMDGDMDVYISNYRLQPNFLFVNRGDFDFRDESERRGVKGYRQQGAYGHTIGSSWADFDNDGDFDLLVGNFAHPWGLGYQDKVMVCISSGPPDYEFTDIREESGIEYCETVFCPAWGDYDNDGWQDLFISSVYPGRQPFMYRNNGDNTFENVNYRTGFHGRCYNSNSVTWCDFDHDGDLDIAIGNGGLFENTTLYGHWVQIQLEGDDANKFGFGSQASVHCGEMHLLRQVEGGMGAQGAQNMMTMHFGLGDYDHIDSLIVTWIDRDDVYRYYDLEVDRRYFIAQGEEPEELWRSPRGIGDEGSVVDIPQLFTLAEPYPNPFNGILTIEFTQAITGLTKLEIYDLSGRLVSVVSERKFSRGAHRITWDAGNMPAGSYLVQATHAGGVVSRMVTLLK